MLNLIEEVVDKSAKLVTPEISLVMEDSSVAICNMNTLAFEQRKSVPKRARATFISWLRRCVERPWISTM